MKRVFFLITLSIFSSFILFGQNQYPFFKKENLIPWSIVGFDSKERTPEERLDMLAHLGFDSYAYGHRPRHIPTMADEWRMAADKGIKVQAVWLYINLRKDSVGHLKTESEVVFQNLEKVGLKTQIWVGFEPTYFDDLTEEQSFTEASEMIKYLSLRAKKLGSKIALYNHGGWYGNPQNQIKVLNALSEQGLELGVVFNFHHAHDQLSNYERNIERLLPYLWCVNLNGMKAGGEKIITIGDGNLEKQMIDKLLELGYTGPFGILGHVKGGDPEVLLQKNYEGLQNLCR